MEKHRKKALDKDSIVKITASKASFTQGDVKAILDSFIETLEDCVRTGNEVKINGLGKLTIGKIKARKGFDAVRGKSIDLPEAVRVNFKLSDNIRFAYKEKKEE